MSYNKNDITTIATKLGRLVNGGVVGYYAGGKTSEVMRNAIPENIVGVVERHKKVQLASSLAQSFVPGAGVAASAAAVASLWKMYYDINNVIGIKVSENAGKSLTSAILTNLSSFAAQGVATAVSEGAKFIPFVGWIVSAGISTATSTAIVYGAAFMYLKALVTMYEVDGEFNINHLNSIINDGDFIGGNLPCETSVEKAPNRRNIRSNKTVNWKDATQKAINLLYKLEMCSSQERRESLDLVESLAIPQQHEATWNQILLIWRTYVYEGQINTKTLPNPDGVRYSQRPFPVTGSSGVQDLIREIVCNSSTQSRRSSIGSSFESSVARKPHKVNTSSNNNADWNEATQKAINLLYQLEKCSFSERKESLSLVENMVVPARYEFAWNQILRIWRTFVNEGRINTKTLPNPDGVRYSQRPFPITGSSGVQDIIKEIIRNV